MKNKNKGITLVALIITIILLLILAGISISALTGSGLFQKAELAKERTDNSQENENEILKEYEDILNRQIDGSRDTAIEDKKYEDLKNKIEQLEEDLTNCKSKVDNQNNLEWTLIDTITTSKQWIEVNKPIDEYNYIVISVYVTNWGDLNQMIVNVKDLKERYNSSKNAVGVYAANGAGWMYYSNDKIFIYLDGYPIHVYGVK